MNFNKFENPVLAVLGEGAGLGVLSSCLHGDSVIDTTNSTGLMTVRGFTLPAKALANLGDCLEVFAAGRFYPDYTSDMRIELGGQVLANAGSWSGWLTAQKVWTLSSKIWRVTSGAVQHYTVWEFIGYSGYGGLASATVDLTTNLDFNIRAQSSNTSYPFTVEVSSAKVLNVPV